MPDHVSIRTALISVSDKTGLVDLARELSARGIEILSTGGTAKALATAGIAVTSLDQVTGFPEMLDGRVKTLHPAVHAGLLARRDVPHHASALREHGLRPIDLLVVNLYPFEATIASKGVTTEEAIEQIDIGGPAMIRSASKNANWVTVITSPAQYDGLLAELSSHDGATSRGFRARLAQAAFARTAAYDAAISAYLTPVGPGEFPPRLSLTLERTGELRYGENPHQRGAAYLQPGHAGPSVLTARQLHGKALSYNNLADASAALELVRALSLVESGVCAAVVKHTNPCGAAIAPVARLAIDRALAGDPLAAYGGILAMSCEFDVDAAARLEDGDVFLEVIVAPEFSPQALDRLRARWKTVRLLAVGPLSTSAAPAMEIRSIPGGFLAQERDANTPEPSTWAHAAGPPPPAPRLRAAAMLECVVRALTSNAVCIGGADGASVRLYGAGAGQMDRVASCRLAVEKAGPLARGGIALSDAFFPFADGPQVLIDAGITMIVHPGGSKRDQDTFDACNAAGVTCMTTGIRRFRH